MATLNPKSNLGGLARCLIQRGALAEEAASQHFDMALRSRVPFVSYLVRERIIAPREVAEIASQDFGVPLFDLDVMDPEAIPRGLVDEKLIRNHQVLPLYRRGNRLFLAMSDPTNHQGLDEIKFHSGLTTSALVVEDDKLTRFIEKALDTQNEAFAKLLDSDLEKLDVEGGDEVFTTPEANVDVDEAPVVRFVHKVLLDAINQKASDIHFEPYERSYRIRFRQDGMLHEVISPPINIAPRLAARIKVMARLNTAERRVPQDGRLKMMLSKSRTIDFRVNTCPTLYGEKVVLRILDPTSAQIGLESLGMEPEQMQHFRRAIEKPYGMILVTGPTGSGKTVSLYTGLNILNTEDTNISTAEDPVEIMLSGVNQVNINPKVGLTFAGALRAFLRQDPDVIMVGEIRDLETAEIALKAAQTGHLVLSTLHTNDAPKTLTRLVDMGVKPYAIATSVSLIIAQRLARRLCSHCKAPMKIPAEALKKEGFGDEEIANGLQIFTAVGCSNCTDGYKGRTGIYEVMPVSEDIGRIIMGGGNVMDIKQQALREGVWGLRQAGLNKVRMGITTLDEINSVTVD